MRVLLMEINQETNTFCATPAVLEDYKRTLFAEGEEMYNRVHGKEVCLGGMIAALEEDGIEVIPGFGIRATAGGVSAAEVYNEFEKRFRRIATECGKIDGCYISFHGSHQSVDSDDVCGDALALARELFGKDIVIACSNDLHGNITKQMFDNADIITAYQTYPHVDHFNTGYRAAKLGNRLLRGEKLYMAYGRTPMIQPANGYSTNEGELKRVMQEFFAEVDNGTIEDFSAFQMQPWLDVVEGGSAVIAIGKDEAAAKAVVKEGLAKMWAIRHDMVRPNNTIDEVIAAAKVREDGKPVVVSDFSDSPNAGAAGDNFDIVGELMAKAPELKVAGIVNDPTLVAECFKRGVGATFETTIGGSKVPEMSKSYPVTLTVCSLHEGSFIIEGPAMAGVLDSAGLTATVKIGNADVVVTSGMSTTGDPQLLRHFGVEPTLYDVAIVKACTSFRVPYGKFAGEMLSVDTLCASSSRLAELPFKKLSREFYPFVDCDHPRQLDEVFCK